MPRLARRGEKPDTLAGPAQPHTQWQACRGAMAARVKDKRSSDKSTAEKILRRFQEELREHSNLGAIVLWLARTKRSVQKRVLDALRGPRKRGAPRRGFSDEVWLDEFEGWRKHMEQVCGPGHRRPSDMALIRALLSNTGTRHGREEGHPFRPESKAGKTEVRRIRDAIVRARRHRRKSPKMA